MWPQPASASTATASEERIRVWRFMAFLLLGFPMEAAIVAQSHAQASVPRTPEIPQRARWNNSGLVDVAPRGVELPRAVLDVRAVGVSLVDLILGIAHVGRCLVDDRFGARGALLAHGFAERLARRVA